MEQFYFKSFVTLEQEAVTTTYNPETDSRRTCQSLRDVLETRIIQPNTTHSQLEKRLCASLLTKRYKETYRPEGIVFETEQEPAYAVPFDMIALTKGKTLTGSEYNSPFIDGFRKFTCDTIDELLERFPMSKNAIIELNNFRKEHGLTPVNQKMLMYNEVCFTKPVQLNPVALIGRGESYQELSRTYNIPIYESMDKFQQRNKEKEQA